MEGNDISNEVVPRLMLVFEGLVGILPAKDERKAERLIRRKKYSEAVAIYEVNEPMAHRMWDITLRLHYSLDVVTWLSPGFAKSVREWVDEHDLPVQHVTYQDKTSFARKISFMPYVTRLYDPDPADRFTWGSKGRIISAHDTQSLDQIGRW